MIDFSDELWEAARAGAEAAKMSRGAFVRQAVSDALWPVGGLVTDSDGPKWQPPVEPLYDFPDDAREMPAVPCPHPKTSRRQLSYGTICDACQEMVR